MRNRDAIIIGGGISGASALHWLAKGGADAVLFERGDALGGVMGSYRNEAGALVETGPNSAQFNTPELIELVNDLKLTGHLVRPAPEAANRYIMRDGKLLPLPRSPKEFLRSSLLSGPAKRRLLREPFISAAPADAEESIAQFAERRLGSEVLDYAVNPFVSGIYAGRPELLSVRYALPLLHELEQSSGSLLKGGIRRMRARKKGRKKGEGESELRGMFSFIDGLSTLPRTIEERWKRYVRTGADIERIDHLGGSWHVVARGERFVAPHLVIATDALTASGLIADHDPEASAALRAVEYPPLAVVTSLYEREKVAHPLDGFGMLVPESEGRNILGVIFSSSLFPGRAPEGHVLLTTFVGGSRSPELALRSREEMEYDVHGELRRALGICAPPRSVDIRLWRRAIPQYNLGYGALLDAFTRAEESLPGFHLLGNYRGGVSVGDCVRSGHDVAEKILADGRGAATPASVGVEEERIEDGE
jgi:oxygen-dependent protoporphyrinogen oxidase